MEILLAGRGQGKTTAMIDWLRQSPADERRALLCYSHVQAQALQHQNDDLASWRFVSPADLPDLRNLRGRRNLVVGVDELDAFLRHYLRLPVALASMSGTVRTIEPR